MSKLSRTSWGWLRRRWEVTYFVALVLMIGGAIIFFAANSIAWLQGAGGVVIGTGFTVLISTITGKRAIQEQYAKEANLRRKDNVYGPLHAELKKVREYLEAADSGAGPYPQWIDLAGQPHPDPTIHFGYHVPRLCVWQQYKADYRADDFTIQARKVLDEVIAFATAYNKAVMETREPAMGILGNHSQEAVSRVTASDEFKEWQHRKQTEPGYPGSAGQATLTRLRWYNFLVSGLERFPDFGKVIATEWLEAWPLQTQPETLGWMVAQRPIEAAALVKRIRSPGSDFQPPSGWLEDIFRSAQPEFDALPSVHTVRSTLEGLLKTVREAEQRLEEGMHFIQQRYEGGEPPV